MKHIISFLTFGCIVLLTLFAGTCKNDSPVKPPQPTPPDTTSHEVVWTEYVFPNTNGELYDVAALSNDFAIAVGEVTEPHTLDHNPNYYLWDGIKWTPKAMPMQWYNGDTNTIHWDLSASPITGVWAFRRDNIWFCSGSSNNAYTHMTIIGTDTMIKTSVLGEHGFGRIWAKDTNEIYFAGSQKILKYDGNSFQLMPTQPLAEIAYDELWGFSSKDIYASSYLSGSPRICIMYDGFMWNTFRGSSNPLSDTLSFGLPIAFGGTADDDSMWIAGLWLARMKKDGTGKIRPIKNLDPLGTHRIRGTKKNNIFFIGGDGVVLHYNGLTIHEYTIFENRNYNFSSLAVTGNDVFIVGFEYFGGTRALIIHGKMK